MKKEDFIKNEGVNYKKIRIQLENGTILNGEINIKKEQSALVYINAQGAKCKFLKISKCSRGGFKADFESLTFSSVMYIEEKNENFKVADKFLHEITVIFRNGRTLNGKIIFDKNKFRRLSDCIDKLNHFFPIFSAGRVMYINNSPYGPLEGIRHK